MIVCYLEGLLFNAQLLQTYVEMSSGKVLNPKYHLMHPSLHVCVNVNNASVDAACSEKYWMVGESKKVLDKLQD